MLAFYPPRVVNRLLRGKLERYTEHTITEPSILKKQLEKAGQEGVAFDYGEININVHAIGSPVFNPEKEPIAAVIAVSPAFRRTDDYESKIIPLLKETTEKISHDLFS